MSDKRFNEDDLMMCVSAFVDRETEAKNRGALILLHFKKVPGFLDTVPAVKDLASEILVRVENDPDALDMDQWHRDEDGQPMMVNRRHPRSIPTLMSCATTHCLAGWAVHLAGLPGYELEALLGPAMAGRLIFAKSYPKHDVPHFWSTDYEALDWLREASKRDQEEG